ncbi:SCO-spondin-like [Haliotis asinina]|uniref:SCO-spondin-like n=1 Tax=Haliotis asinina TaxID=109174 RepID=UPI003531CB4E
MSEMKSLQRNLIVIGFCLISLQLSYQQSVFQQPLQDMNVEPGNYGNMEVTVSPGITDAGQWFKDGVQLFNTPGRMQIVSSGQLRQLVIFSLILSDTGRYTLTIRGQSTSAYLTVGDVVVGVWGEWTQWVGPPCPATCGPTATHNATRSRTCSFANSCSGVGTQSAFRSCGPVCGAVNGNWGTWSQWSIPSCPATCGPTARRDITRTRNCDNPAPTGGGAPCAGQREQRQNEACAPATCAPSIFSKGLSSDNRGVGEQVLFEVTFTQAPAPGTIGTWRKNGVVIEDGGKFVIASAGNSQYLYITALDIVDSGRYSYTYNGETTEAQLTVGTGPVNGNWGAWSQWSGPPCPATCGPTARRNVERIRSCNNPAPSSGGAPCPGDNRQSEVQDCAPAVCVSAWNNWGQWIDPGCPRSCGVGVTRTATRRRTCNQQPGQPFCSGSSEEFEIRACSLPLCPVSTWNNWGQWIDPGCPRTCGIGVTRTATRRRTCNQQPGQPFCSGSSEESEVRACNLPSCPGTWNNWGDWIDPGCPRTCGVDVTRTATRRRTCNQQPGQLFCSGSGEEFEVRACSLPLCPGTWNNWGQWIDPGCPRTCGVGVTRTATRRRTCNQQPGQLFCSGSGEESEIRACSLPLCPVNGNWGEWTQWSGPPCSATCGPTATRTITRSRSCNNPPPSNGGASCPGQSTVNNELSCGPSVCDSVTSTWNNWGQWIDPGCPRSCGVGVTRIAIRTRTCNQQPGQPFCSGSNEISEVRTCNLPLCPVNGNWGGWTQWSGPPCPATCGPTATRTITRSRTCNNPPPSNGGASCPGQGTVNDELSCGPSVCVQSSWNNWGQWIDPGCPRTCGIGVTRTATRRRTCNQQPGQPFCSGPSDESEVRTCSVPLCPVSTWSNWGQWIDPGCPRTCGDGVTRTVTRRRTCNQQPGQPFCSGSGEESEVRPCSLPLCPVSTWNNWGQWIDPGCPRTCGVGVTRTATRTRICNQQPGQPFCSGPSDESEVRACSVPLCPVNGNWGEWTQWSGPPCSVTCGPTAIRTITRSRSCNNPPPSNGGASCPGQSTATNELSCGPSICDSVTSTWSNWGQWIDPGCPRTCGVGVTRTVTRRRTCIQQPNQPFCSGSNEDSEVRACELPLCPVNGNWGEWTGWSVPQCPATCGPTATTTISRSRTCNNPPPSNGGASCFGLGIVTNEFSCGPSVCVQSSWNNWGQWIDPGCPRSCGAGVTRTVTRSRTCNQQPGQPFCSGSTEDSEVRACNLPLCPVNGNWGEWSEWSGLPCPATCGPTARRNVTRSRSCNNPTPSSGGVVCSGQGSMTETVSCGPSFCANVTINGGYSEWSAWSTGQCSVPCGDGMKTDTRTRSCTDPTPQNGGLPCSGPSTENRTESCNVACQVSPWSNWAGPVCPATCGRQVRVVQERSRTCTVLNPRGSDNTCGVSRLQRRNFTCIDVLCPVDGGFSPWSVWVTYNYCTGTCEAEVETFIRTRSCNNPTPAFNGRPCEGDTLQTKQELCVTTPDCTGSGINGNYTEWTQWGGPSCPATCGPLARHTVTRERYCTNPPPSNGGAPCIGDSTQTQVRDCGTAAVCETPVVWSDWGRWVDPGCLVTCGVGVTRTSQRTRTCNQRPGQPTCPGNNTQAQVLACNLPVCQVIYRNWSQWSQWTTPPCAATCGPSARHTVERTRTCIGGTGCPGEGKQSENRSCGSSCPTTGAPKTTGTIVMVLMGAAVSLCLM